MAYLAARNPRLDPRFSGIAAQYMRHGEELSLRWDVVFFQMIVETRSLEFRRGNGAPASVRPAQNNFAAFGFCISDMLFNFFDRCGVDERACGYAVHRTIADA